MTAPASPHPLYGPPSQPRKDPPAPLTQSPSLEDRVCGCGLTWDMADLPLCGVAPVIRRQSP